MMMVPTRSLGPLDPQPDWRADMLAGLTKQMVVTVLVVGAMLLAFIVGLARMASADGLPLVERRATVCEDLGYGTPDCTPRWEGKAKNAVLELIVDSHVGEPDYRCGTCHESEVPAQASAVILHTSAGTSSQIYQQSRFDDTEWGLALVLAPCLTTHCVEARESDPSYEGPTEETLRDDYRAVLTKALWQTGDSAMQDQLRRMHGKTGTPVIVKINKRDSDLVDETHSDLPTSVTIPVKIRFALPAPE